MTRDGEAPGPLVELFTTGPACTLCEAAWRHLLELRGELRFISRKVRLDAETRVPPDYVIRAPVVHVAGRAVIEGRIAPAALATALRAAGVPAR